MCGRTTRAPKPYAAANARLIDAQAGIGVARLSMAVAKSPLVAR